MTDLRTLNDIESDWDRNPPAGVIRQEAIKWVKCFKHAIVNGGYPKNGSCDCETCCECETRKFIKFFNLSEEDLK